MPGSRSEKIYESSPVWAQQAMVASFGAWWFLRRFNHRFHRNVRELNARERWTHDAFHRYQEARLARLLAAARRSSWYGRQIEEASRDGASPFETLAKMPLLEKETLRREPANLLTRPPERGTVVLRSSGTTGTPSEIYFAPAFHAWQMAIAEARNLNWHGVNYRDRRVMLGVRKVCNFDQEKPPFWRFSPVENMAYLSIYHLSPQFLPHYMEFLREYRPAVVMGYPNALNVIARYALEHDDLPAPARVVCTTSETVTDSIREAIEAAWQCRLADRYGAVESALFVSQCEHGRYHVSPEAGIVEILDRDGAPSPPGVLGEVVCTGLRNTLQPLIRYRLGDAAKWAPEQNCPCGRQMPILQSIEGRYEHLCRTPDGRELLRFDTVFKGVHSIREAQVVQEEPALFTLNVVPTPQFSAADEATLKQNMKQHAGDVQVRIEKLDRIPRSDSGKFQAVICKLPRERR